MPGVMRREGAAGAAIPAALRSLSDALCQWGQAVELSPSAAEATEELGATLEAIAGDLENSGIGRDELSIVATALRDFCDALLAMVRAGLK